MARKRKSRAKTKPAPPEELPKEEVKKEERTMTVRALTNLGLSEPDVDHGFLIIRQGQVMPLKVEVAKRLIREGKAEKA
ncbi:MAG: hypothetical protein DRJ60_01170 [Thermoprotei archaeon]|nr:MAG: hypothetical protein DRJ60_01170 [Thermoprotei archaeon]